MRTGLSVRLLVGWLGIALSKFSRWSRRRGTPNRHNAPIPRALLARGRGRRPPSSPSIDRYPLEGYRRLAYMMLDADVVAVSPSSVYRVLKAAGKLAARGGKASRKGTGFEQPLRPHEHWHIDVSYINVCGTFFFLCSILDGYSRFAPPLGDPRDDDRSRGGDDHPAGTRAVPRRHAPGSSRTTARSSSPGTSRSSSASAE